MWKKSRESEEEIQINCGRNRKKVWKKSKESMEEIEGKCG